MDDLFKIIISDTYTLTDLQRRVNLLKDTAEANIFGSKAPIAQEQDKEWLDTIVPKLKVNKENSSDTFKKLHEKIKKIQPLLLFVAIPLPDQEATELGKKARILFDKDLLIEIRLDPLLIGGAAIGWNGIYEDFSIRKRINEHKKEIIESFQKYIK